MSATFISEAITPVGTSFLTTQMVAGEPGMPRAFSWRGKRIDVREILDQWKELGDCSHGSGERYLRKHWYRIRADDETEMKIYFERQARSNSKTRWFLYTLTVPELSQGRNER